MRCGNTHKSQSTDGSLSWKVRSQIHCYEGERASEQFQLRKHPWPLRAPAMILWLSTGDNPCWLSPQLGSDRSAPALRLLTGEQKQLWTRGNEQKALELVWERLRVAWRWLGHTHKPSLGAASWPHHVVHAAESRLCIRAFTQFTNLWVALEPTTELAIGLTRQSSRLLGRVRACWQEYPVCDLASADGQDVPGSFLAWRCQREWKQGIRWALQSSCKEHPPGALQCNVRATRGKWCFIYDDAGLHLLYGSL